jgi:hypothetical protein
LTRRKSERSSRCLGPIVMLGPGQQIPPVTMSCVPLFAHDVGKRLDKSRGVVTRTGRAVRSGQGGGPFDGAGARTCSWINHLQAVTVGCGRAPGGGGTTGAAALKHPARRAQRLERRRWYEPGFGTTPTSGRARTCRPACIHLHVQLADGRRVGGVRPTPSK